MNAKKYVMKSQGIPDRVLFVSAGLGDPPKWGTFYRRNEKGGKHRFVSKSMPMVDSQEQAQINLENFASKNKLKQAES